MLSVGLVGLPNVGKSTLFNALTAGQAVVDSYPFTTIESNVGVVAVPDARLRDLEHAIEPQESIASRIEFIDIAGLVEGASRGEGLGNQFLGSIRQVDAVVHVLRCFEEENISHVFASVDPARDVQVIETELMLADLEVLERASAKRQKQWQTKPREFAAERECFERYCRALEAGQPLRNLEPSQNDLRQLKALGMLTGKPILYAANVSEEGYGRGEAEIVKQLREVLRAPVITISAKIEAELAQLDSADRELFMQELAIEQPGLDRLVESAFHQLGLIRFYTLANQKLRAWEIERGAKAPSGAGRIHTDMERGFIRAQVAGWELVVEHRSLHELHHLGLLRTEGRDYEIQDGDVCEFLFHA